jgi:hypothetical protein
MPMNLSVRGSFLRFVITSASFSCLGVQVAAQQPRESIEYRVLATSRTSTMEKELNETAEAGFRFHSAMGGDTAFGGGECVVVMARTPGAKGHLSYKLLATTKTSTMQQELQEAAREGFVYKAQTVFKTTFGGKEVIVILERDPEAMTDPVEYRLVATSRTSTLQKELNEAGTSGYEVLGLTVAKTALGGEELVAIARRPRQPPSR